MASTVYNALAYWINLATVTLNASTETPNNSQPYVWYGATLGRYIAPLTLQVIGIHDLIHEWAELGSQFRVEERYKIQCGLVSYAGDMDFLGRTKEVFDNFLLLSVALAHDYDLGHNIRVCRPISEGEVIPIPQPSGGSMCSLMFYIQCEARIATLT